MRMRTCVLISSVLFAASAFGQTAQPQRDAATPGVLPHHSAVQSQTVANADDVLKKPEFLPKFKGESTTLPSRKYWTSNAPNDLNDPNAAGCYFIRSYVFERQDGNAPELVGATTCTPAKANAFQKARKGGARFVPLVR